MQIKAKKEVILNKDDELKEAVLKKDKELIKRKIEDGTDVEQQFSDIDNSTLLHIACAEGWVDIVDLLLKNKGDITAKTKGDYTPLQKAVQNGHLEVVKLLLANGGDWEKLSPSPYKESSGSSSLWSRKLNNILKPQELSHESSKGALYLAAQAGHREIVKLLMEHGWDISSRPRNMNEEISELYDYVQNIQTLNRPINNKTNLNDYTRADLAHGQGYGLLRKEMVIRGWDFIPVNKNTHHSLGKDLRDIDFAKVIFKNWIRTKSSNKNFKDKDFNLETIKTNIESEFDCAFPNLKIPILKQLEAYEKDTLDKINLIEGIIFSYFYDIAPVPNSYFELDKDNEKIEENGEATEAYEKWKKHPNPSESSNKETKNYWEFWNNPNNAKYKVTGTKLLELTKEVSATNILALAEIFIRATHSNGYGNNELVEIKNGVMELRSRLLNQEMNEALNNVFEQYNRYENDPVMKAYLSLENINDTNIRRIDNMQNLINKLTQQLGTNHDSLTDEASADQCGCLEHTNAVSTIGEMNIEDYAFSS